MYYIIDRIEGDFAVCENSLDGKMHDILLADLPEGVKEGDIIKSENGVFIIDYEEKEKRENDIRDKIKNAWN